MDRIPWFWLFLFSIAFSNLVESDEESTAAQPTSVVEQEIEEDEESVTFE